MSDTSVEKSQIASIAGSLLRKAGSTATDLVRQVRVFHNDLARRPETPLPEQKSMQLPAEQEDALLHLAALAANVSIPHKRRVLTAPELTSFIHLFDTLAQVKRATERLDGAAKAVLHNHFDARLEQDGEVTDTTPYHEKKGWFCVPDTTSGHVPSEQITITREVSGGGPVITEAQIAALRDTGKITQRDYLLLTHTPAYRVISDDAVIARVNEDPDFAQHLLDIAPETPPTPSIHLRPAK